LCWVHLGITGKIFQSYRKSGGAACSSCGECSPALAKAANSIALSLPGKSGCHLEPDKTLSSDATQLDYWLRLEWFDRLPKALVEKPVCPTLIEVVCAPMFDAGCGELKAIARKPPRVPASRPAPVPTRAIVVSPKFGYLCGTTMLPALKVRGANVRDVTTAPDGSVTRKPNWSLLPESPLSTSVAWNL